MSEIPVIGERRPRLRPLDPVPFEHDGEPRVAWRDPIGIAPLVEVPHAVAVLMTLMDGSRTPAELRERWREVSGEDLPGEFLDRMVEELDEHLLLDGPRYRQARAEALAAYRSQGTRPAAHCPGAYPDDPQACRAYLDELVERGGAEARSLRSGPVTGLVAPHIDLARGGTVYGAAYHALKGSDADLFVVLGVAHSSSLWPDPPPLATITRLDFETPLGVARTDQAFVDRLVAGVAAHGGDPEALFIDELAHQGEHSVEFEVLFLRHLCDGRECHIVPILTGPPDAFFETPAAFGGPDGLGPLAAALRDAIAGHDGRVCIVAGADLAHVGPRFGDGEPVDERRLHEIAAADEDALRRFVQGGAEPFFEHFAADRNARHVCSVSNLYLLRRLLPDAEVELLRWDAAYDPQQTVSFAAAALR